MARSPVLCDAPGAGRFAPSPSGELHLGNLRTAMLAWMFARATGRRFLLRIDDLDRDRDSGSASGQLADLAALGLDWDGAVVRQAQRGAAYEAAIDSLRARGLVYECTCSRRDILAAPSAPHAPPGAYPGTCRALTPSERRAARAQRAPHEPALRLRVPEATEPFSVEDRILGPITAPVDDLVLRRGDGTVSYMLATVVDDAASGIDQIVRGDDLASSTPRQVLLQRLLGLSTPHYAHVPLVLGRERRRLAKRDGAVTLGDLARSGQSPEEVRGLLAQSLQLAAQGELVTPAQLVERFDPERIPRAPWVFGATS